MTWVCSQCGFTNNGTECHGCGASRPDYGHHVRVLNLGRGPVFNGPVNVAVLAPEKALEAFYGKVSEEERQPTSWEQFVGFSFKVILTISLCVIGVVIAIFALLFLGVVFGW